MPRSASSIEPLLVGGGAGERAAHVAEQLGLEQRFRQRAAVERDERPVAPRRVEVDGARHQLLARARLAGDQDRAGGGGDGLDEPEDRRHHLAAADDVAELVHGAERPLEQQVLLLQLPALLAQLPLLERLADHLDDGRGELRAALLDVVRRAQPQGLDRGLLRGVGGDHDPEDVGVELLGGAQHLDAAHVGHADVGDEQVDPAGLEQPDGVAPVLGEHDVEPLPLQAVGQQLPDRGLVVDEEDLRRGRRHVRHRASLTRAAGSWQLAAGSRSARHDSSPVPQGSRDGMTESRNESADLGGQLRQPFRTSARINVAQAARSAEAASRAPRVTRARSRDAGRSAPSERRPCPSAMFDGTDTADFRICAGQAVPLFRREPLRRRCTPRSASSMARLPCDQVAVVAACAIALLSWSQRQLLNCRCQLPAASCPSLPAAPNRTLTVVPFPSEELTWISPS